MAFWKKSDDPWDREPGKKDKTAWWEQDAPSVGAGHQAGPERAPAGTDSDRPQESERLGDSIRKLFQAEKETAIAPEKCPWCGKDMEWGCITGGRDGVTWKNWKPKGLGIMRPEGWKELDLLDEGEWILYKTVWLCADCGKLVADIRNCRPAAEVEEAYRQPTSYAGQLEAWGAQPKAYEDYQAQWGTEKKEET